MLCSNQTNSLLFHDRIFQKITDTRSSKVNYLLSLLNTRIYLPIVSLDTVLKFRLQPYEMENIRPWSQTITLVKRRLLDEKIKKQRRKSRWCPNNASKTFSFFLNSFSCIGFSRTFLLLRHIGRK